MSVVILSKGGGLGCRIFLKGKNGTHSHFGHKWFSPDVDVINLNDPVVNKFHTYWVGC